MEKASFDVIIVGAGVSGSFMSLSLTRAGLRCLLLEAGTWFKDTPYPTKEIDANSKLYWSGGMELNDSADLVFLRPKCVGGGSIVNQALVDRFDTIALDSWRETSGISTFNREFLDPWYERAESELSIQYIPEKFQNRNAEIFKEGFRKNGYRCSPLRRAQKDCKYEDGNDCIECLSGCPIRSKQSMPWTTLQKSLETGLLTILPEFEVNKVLENKSGVEIEGVWKSSIQKTFTAKKLVLASGAIGNSRLLLKSGYAKSHPRIGKGFYTHPQFMNFALYDEPVRAHKGPFQSLKSDDPDFRSNGFKLENVYAPPVALSMLFSGVGTSHQELMQKMPYLACIEFAVRDTEPGDISLKSSGQPLIRKTLNKEDHKRKDKGLEAVRNIFKSTGAKKIIQGEFGVGLHLMGGCSIGVDTKKSVVGPNFNLHGSDRIFISDSSIFPNAPGINPSLTIMALSLLAAEQVQK